MWQDSKRSYEIPSSLALLGFGSDRRLAAHSLSKTSTSASPPLRMTGEGLLGVTWSHRAKPKPRRGDH